MPIQALARMLLGVIFSNPKTKTAIVSSLREAAKSTETKFDDAAVDTFESMYDVIVPVVVGKR